MGTRSDKKETNTNTIGEEIKAGDEHFDRKILDFGFKMNAKDKIALQMKHG